MAFDLETERLRLVALDVRLMRLRLCDRQRMERELGLAPASDPTYGSPDYDAAGLRAARDQADRMEKADCDYRWRTFWQIVLKRERRIIGEIDFHGPPDAEGRVEFGYGMQAEYRNRGYMTEAARALLAWAFSHPEITAVVAETDKDNAASARVLQKNGAVFTHATPERNWWKIQRAVP